MNKKVSLVRWHRNVLNCDKQLKQLNIRSETVLIVTFQEKH
nr:MAG TPA: hypothetical protein [Caudoviricetes sp.]